MSASTPAGLAAPPLNVTVAVVPATETLKLKSVVEPLWASSSVMAVASKVRTSLPASDTLVTVMTICSTSSAASIKSTEASLKSTTGALPSTKDGSSPVADTTGSSLTGTTVTVDEIASVTVSSPPLVVPPLSCSSVMVTTRLPAVGSSLLF